MKSRIFAAAAAAAILALSLSACAQQASVVGTWGAPDSTNSEPGLLLSEDGKVSGTDGCNRLMGSYEADGETVTFGPLASTLMFCEGVDTWLGKAVTGVVSGDQLTLSDQDGAEIGTLERGAE